MSFGPASPTRLQLPPSPYPALSRPALPAPAGVEEVEVEGEGGVVGDAPVVAHVELRHPQHRLPRLLHERLSTTLPLPLPSCSRLTWKPAVVSWQFWSEVLGQVARRTRASFVICHPFHPIPYPLGRAERGHLLALVDGNLLQGAVLGEGSHGEDRDVGAVGDLHHPQRPILPPQPTPTPSETKGRADRGPTEAMRRRSSSESW